MLIPRTRTRHSGTSRIPLLFSGSRRFVYYVRRAAGRWAELMYDTIRDAILTCARKPSWVSLIYRTETTTKKCKNRRTKSRKQICSEITVNSLGNPCSESWRRKTKGCSGKDLKKRKVLSLEWKSEWVMEYQLIVSMTVVASYVTNSVTLICRCTWKFGSKVAYSSRFVRMKLLQTWIRHFRLISQWKTSAQLQT